MREIRRDNARNLTESMRNPRQRWGTCCPFDPECEHSLLTDVELLSHLERPISDDEAADLGGRA